MFVGFNADGSNGFAILAMVDLPSGTAIHFNDNAWNNLPVGSGGAFTGTGESEMTWTNTTGMVIAAGTVITFAGGSGGPFADIGSISGNNISLSGTDETIYAFIGSSNTSPTVFLSAIGNQGSYEIAGTGLSIGETAIAITGSNDVMVYTGGITCNGTFTECITMIASPSNWAKADGTGDQSNDSVAPDFPTNVPGSFSGSVFPIELLYFRGEAFLSSIHLSWSTATEHNNDYMAVERSADGMKFEELGRVKGAGTTEEPQEYTFVDENPIRGLNYYRLRQVDFDGAFEYHKTISVLFTGKSSGLGVQAFPNPAQATLQASWAAHADQPTSLILLDMTGRQLAQYQTQAGVSTFEVPLSNLPAGLYFLQARQGQEMEVLRFRKE